jgi:REP-associated tyrosine transposase
MQPRHEYRRRLPHYQPDSKVFFITFCTHRGWHLPEHARHIVPDACLRGNGGLFDLLAAVVMPDHVRLALVPKALPDGTVPVPKVLQVVKGASAHRITRELGRRGAVWQQESFERALRREEDLDQKIDYMLENPVASRTGAESVGLSLDLAEGGWTRKGQLRGKLSVNMRRASSKSGLRPDGRGRPSLHRSKTAVAN